MALDTMKKGSGELTYDAEFYLKNHDAVQQAADGATKEMEGARTQRWLMTLPVLLVFLLDRIGIESAETPGHPS